MAQAVSQNNRPSKKTMLIRMLHSRFSAHALSKRFLTSRGNKSMFLGMKAVFPGTFDPPTNGHLNLIERASQIMERVLVVVSDNSQKSCLFTPQERHDFLVEMTGHLPNVEIHIWGKLIVPIKILVAPNLPASTVSGPFSGACERLPISAMSLSSA